MENSDSPRFVLRKRYFLVVDLFRSEQSRVDNILVLYGKGESICPRKPKAQVEKDNRLERLCLRYNSMEWLAHLDGVANNMGELQVASKKGPTTSNIG
jgi:hypothetical protein